MRDIVYQDAGINIPILILKAKQLLSEIQTTSQSDFLQQQEATQDFTNNSAEHFTMAVHVMFGRWNKHREMLPVSQSLLSEELIHAAQDAVRTIDDIEEKPVGWNWLVKPVQQFTDQNGKEFFLSVRIREIDTPEMADV